MDVLTADSLCVEISRTASASRYKLDIDTIKEVWKELSLYISNALRAQKGVLLPSVGYFSVGSIKEDKFTVKHKLRPTFSLQEGRFSGVPQETPKYHLTGVGAILQPNYNVIGASMPLHRSVMQHLVKQLLQRVSLHIAAGHFVQLDFPSVGRLATNKAGRLEFQFETTLLEFLDNSLHKKLFQYKLADAAMKEFEGERPSTAGSRPFSAPRALSAPRSTRDKTPTPRRRSRVVLDDDLIERDAEMIAFDYVRQLCRESDRVGSGFVDRLQLEQWLHQRCRNMLAQLDALAFLDLLYAHTHGTVGRFVRYNVFLDGLFYHTQLKNLPAEPVVDEPPANSHQAAKPSPPSPLWQAAAQPASITRAPAPQPSYPAPGVHSQPAALAPQNPQNTSAPYPPGTILTYPSASGPAHQPPQAAHPFELPPPAPAPQPATSVFAPAAPQATLALPQQPVFPAPALAPPQPAAPAAHPFTSAAPPHAPHTYQAAHLPPTSLPAQAPFTSSPMLLPAPWSSVPIQGGRHEVERLALDSSAGSLHCDFHLTDYYKQRKDTPSRSDCDEFNRYHFMRLFETRGSKQALPPKVQQDPLNVEDTPFGTPWTTPRARSAAGTSMIVQAGASQ